MCAADIYNKIETNLLVTLGKISVGVCNGLPTVVFALDSHGNGSPVSKQHDFCLLYENE